VDAGPGLGDLDGLVDRVRLDHRVPAENLLGLHERAVGDRAGPDRLGRRGALELVTAVEPASRAPLLVPGADLGVPAPVLGTVRGRLVRRVQDQQHVLHASLLLVVGACLEAPYVTPTNAALANPTRAAEIFLLLVFPNSGAHRLLGRQTSRSPDQSSS